MSDQKKVLIVEDDQILRNILHEKFEGSGFIALVASDGTEGLQKSLSEHPDIIILDVLLPKMDGIQMLKKLREDAWGATVPVICLSNLDPDAEILEEINDSHPSYYLIKSNAELSDVVEKAKGTCGMIESIYL